MNLRTDDIEAAENCDQNKPVRVDWALCAGQIKESISSILFDAISGRDPSLRYAREYIRWGKVEQEMHKAVDAVLGGA